MAKGRTYKRHTKRRRKNQWSLLHSLAAIPTLFFPLVILPMLLLASMVYIMLYGFHSITWQTLPSVQVPNLTFSQPALPHLSMPSIALPQVSVPVVPSVSFKVSVPHLPSIAPHVSVPTFHPPVFAFHMPKPIVATFHTFTRNVGNVADRLNPMHPIMAIKRRLDFEGQAMSYFWHKTDPARFAITSAFSTSFTEMLTGMAWVIVTTFTLFHTS